MRAQSLSGSRPDVTASPEAGSRSSGDGRPPPALLDVIGPACGAEDVVDVADPLGAPGLFAPEAEPADGRAARSHRTRRAIVDAMRSLHAEGDLRPTAPRVAERAGVSLRTVWQQFADMETLLVEACRRDLEVLLSLVQKIEPDQPLEARITLFVSQRSRVLEEMTPTWRAARIHKPSSQQLRRNKAQMIARARAELEAVFALEFTQLGGEKRQRLIDSLHAISIWAFWESLRTDLCLGPEQARELLRAIFTALLAEAGFW
jgi:TetR/AcrR family transcriptional regulator of autoinduction and epiphytic fitness